MMLLGVRTCYTCSGRFRVYGLGFRINIHRRVQCVTGCKGFLSTEDPCSDCKPSKQSEEPMQDPGIAYARVPV